MGPPAGLLHAKVKHTKVSQVLVKFQPAGETSQEVCQTQDWIVLQHPEEGGHGGGNEKRNQECGMEWEACGLKTGKTCKTVELVSTWINTGVEVWTNIN